MRTIGLDVHKRFAEVAILRQGERTVRRGDRIDATPGALRAFAETLGPDDEVVLEATVNTWAIAELLRGRAGRVVVSNPMRTRAIADAKIKTDRVDAAVLAQLLASDCIPEVWLPDQAKRERRRRIVDRSTLVQQRTRERNRVHAVLHRNLVGYLGLDPRVRQSGDRPARTGHISRRGRPRSRGLPVEAAHLAIRTPGPLRAFHERTRARRGSQIAAMAVARNPHLAPPAR